MKLVTHLFLIASMVLIASTAWAQDGGPDIRSIRPSVMLLMDTSGSMERVAGCTCTTAACTECYPTCGDSSVSQRNRWANMVEIMTGSWGNNFSCTAQDRRDTAFVGEYDYGYFIPHHALPLTQPQEFDGIIDVYQERVKFGLMTFDNIGTLATADPLVPQSTFETSAFLTDSTAAAGMYSYGERKLLTFPGCADDYMVDLGARGEGTHPGALQSVGLGVEDYIVINSRVQDSILTVRPFGGTPIAAMLDDVKYYYNNHPDILNDDFVNCRPHYVMMITDGYPDQDYRDARFDCDGLDAFGNPSYSCPYDLPTNIASDLCQYDSVAGACKGRVKGVFVIGFNVSDTAAATLNDIAAAGGTQAALFASSSDELRARVSEALDAAAPGATTRSAPAFVTPSNSGTQGQYQFAVGFRVSTTDGEPWTGILERKRFVCDPLTLEPVEQTISNEFNDRFEVVLNNRVEQRKLYTVAHGTRASDMEGVIKDATMTPFTKDNTALTRDLFGTMATQDSRKGGGQIITDERRAEIIDWVHGVDGTPRQGKRLGDIYHSSPKIVGPPNADIADEAYNLFRQRTDVANRPAIVYVGSNDGILHAFVAEDHDDGSGTITPAGTELWGFIPPLLVPKLHDMVTARQFMVDSTPIIKDVYFSRYPGATPSADQYHTVLITGMRSGGRGFIALDITDPFHPKFLWQFSDLDMGLTYGRAAIGQVLVNFNGVLQERAVALLPGGTGAIDVKRDTGPIGCEAGGIGEPPVTEGTTIARSRQNCWNQKQGRQFFFVDVATGTVLHNIDHRTWNAPIIGTPALFTGEVGTIAKRAYVMDADGVLWRINLGSATPSEWTAEPYHDIFWDGAAKDGQPTYEAPVLTVDEDGHMVLIHGTGNTDVLDGIVPNRVVSLTETISYGDLGETWKAKLNWEVRLDAGELLTGPIDLFDSRVFFGTFKSVSDTSDACAFGASRVWGVHYNKADAAITDTLVPAGGIEYPQGSGTYVRHFPELSNVLVMGVGVTQRPTCYDETEETDPYLGTRTVVNATGGGEYQLVALAGGDSEKATGQVIGTITRTLHTPADITRVLSVVPSTE